MKAAVWSLPEDLMKFLSILVIPLGAFTLAACSFTLASDITPPPDYVSPTPILPLVRCTLLLHLMFKMARSFLRKTVQPAMVIKVWGMVHKACNCRSLFQALACQKLPVQLRQPNGSGWFRRVILTALCRPLLEL